MSVIPFSIIIPAKNSASTLGECLVALLNQEGFNFPTDYEVIVIDDGSDDQTAEVARKFKVKVTQQENAGPAAARNTGAWEAAGELLFFTDADCIPRSDWLQKMSKPFQNPLVMGVKGAYICQEKSIIARFVQLEFAYKYKAMAKLESIDFIDTYSAAYRRSVFVDNFGFNEKFPVPSVEDQEFSYRLARKGYKLVFEPSAQVRHRHDLTLGEYIQRKWGIGYWKAFLLRWLPDKTFSDSYTPASQRLQILLAALLFSALVLTVLNPFFIILALSFLILFYLIAIPFLVFIGQRDGRVLIPALFLLPVRAITLGFGLLAGFLFPPAEKNVSKHGLRIHERFFKRLLDVFSALIGLILFSPFMLIAIFAIKIESHGPAIFTQIRAGENGKPFRLFKLRTMVEGAEDQLKDMLNATGNHLQNPVFKFKTDPRVTKVGRFLRRWSIDEAPQFLNILRGEMSLVGPRPEETWVVSQYNDFQRQRLLVKPGLTGPMQVSGRADLDFNDRLACELDYINGYSFRKDLIILWKSIGAVISGKGAY